MREWRAEQVVWTGDTQTMCEAPGCVQPAVLLADYDQARNSGVPVCVADADRLLERAASAELSRGIQLPDLFDREPPARRPVGLSWWELADRSPEKWLAENGFYGPPVDTSDPDWDVPF